MNTFTTQPSHDAVQRTAVLPNSITDLMDQVLDPANLKQAWKRVRSNKGAPGIDGLTIEEFPAYFREHGQDNICAVRNGQYQPYPVKRVYIEKDDGSLRGLGIPTTFDRLIQQAMVQVLSPLFDPTFSEYSYGFRPKRSQHQAVRKVQEHIAEGRKIVVDVDLSKFFDRIHHDRLIARLGGKIADKRILRLIGLILRSGVMHNGLVSPTREGSVQGSPLSPLLSNVVLDELDKELESRGLEFCRFADDCNIFVKSPKAAERVMAGVSQFIEKRLRLKINRDKSQVARSEKVKFLGLTIIGQRIAISAKSLQRAMDKVKVLTPRGSHLKLEKAMEAINRWYRGWSSYYSMTQYPAQLRKIEAHIRRRLRSRLVDQQKSRRNLFRKLIKRGVSRGQSAKAVFANRKRWALSHTRAVEKAYPNRWFIKEVGQFIRSEEKREHWLDVHTWIRLV